MTNDTNGLHDLPEGWVWTTFDSIVENHDSMRVPVKASHRENMQGSYPYYGASGIIDHVNEYLFDGDYLLVAEDGANLLSRSTPIAFRAYGKFWVNNHAHVVKMRDGCLMGYLEAYLNSIDLKFSITGTAQPKLTQANLNKIPIPLAPLPEQQHIVTEIEKQFTRLDAGSAALKRAQANLKRYKAAVLKAACEGKLVEQDASDEPASELLARILAERRSDSRDRPRTRASIARTSSDVDQLPELPRGWCWTTLGQVAEIAADLVDPTIMPNAYHIAPNHI
jgi:type I restriction enzyme, S subunit